MSRSKDNPGLRMLALAQRADRVAGLAHAASVGRPASPAQIRTALAELVDYATLIEQGFADAVDRPSGLHNAGFLRQAIRGAIGGVIGSQPAAGISDELLDNVIEMVLVEFGHLKMETRR